MKDVLTLPHDAVFGHLWNPQPTLPPKQIMLRWSHFNFELKAVDEADSTNEAIDAYQGRRGL
jgi:hypothetical protein